MSTAEDAPTKVKSHRRRVTKYLTLGNVGDTTYKSVKIACDLANNLGGVAAAGVLSSVLEELYEGCQEVFGNRTNAQRMCAHGSYLAISVLEQASKEQTGETLAAISEATTAIKDIKWHVDGWESKRFWWLFLHKGEVGEKIEELTAILHSRMQRLGLTVSFEQIKLQLEGNKLVAAYGERIIAQINGLQAQVQDVQKSIVTSEGTTGDMKLIQEQLQSEEEQNNPERKLILAKRLWAMQQETGSLLPSHGLRRNAELQIIGEEQGGYRSETRKALYLGTQVVAIKKLRPVMVSGESARRLQRQHDVWQAIYKEDRGKHILPIYGTYWESNILCFISPFMTNGTADRYMRTLEGRDDVRDRHIELFSDIAKGIIVLHGMNICHGDINGSSIYISDSGRGLIGDFGLAKIMNEDSEGNKAQMTQSATATHLRWHPPELQGNNSKELTPGVDVWSFGMTVLELTTYTPPYRPETKSDPEVSGLIREGKLPTRPGDEPLPFTRNEERKKKDEEMYKARGINSRIRGLDDELWNLLLKCWTADPRSRPSMKQVLEWLPKFEPMQDAHDGQIQHITLPPVA